MRSAVAALALLALLTSPGQARLGLGDVEPALPLPGRDDAARGPDAAGPRVRILLENSGRARDVTVNVTDSEGRNLASRGVHLADPAEVTLEVPLERVAFHVVVEERPLYLVHAGGAIMMRGSLVDCDGPLLVGFRMRGDSYMGLGGGCLVPPAGFWELVAEARAALAARPLGAPVLVPMPGGEDEGAFAWGDAEVAFRWEPSTVAAGPWGDPVEGPAVTWTHDVPSSAGSGGTLGVLGLPLLGATAEVDVRFAPHLVRFRHGDASPWGYTAALSPSASFTGGAAQAMFLEEFAFAPPLGGPPCLFRHALQGRDVAPGGAWPAGALCLAGPLAARAGWVAGAPAEHRGYKALPLTLVAERGPWTVAARAWLAEGVPYPLDAVVMAWAPEQPRQVATFRLERLRGAGEALAAGAPAPVAVPVLSSAPLDPLAGPALGPARVRVPFPLEAASAAARADVLHTDLQALLRRDDAALVGAVLRPLRGATDGVETLAWDLVFAAPGAAPVGARCERPRAPAPGLASAPAARCGALEDAAALAAALALPDDAGAATLPAVGVPWDVALERWAALDPANASAPVTFARYQPYGDLRPYAPQPLLATGHTFAPSPSPLPREGGLSYAAVDLVSGQTVLGGRAVSRVAGLGAVPEAIAPGRASVLAVGSPGLAADAPLLAGAAVVGLAALALVFAKGGAALLYTRLSRPKLLEQDARARVHRMVAEEPGLHASEVARRLGGGHGLAEYHLGVLVREGYLTTVATPGFRRYFVTGKLPPAEMRARAALAQGRAASALRAVQARPGMTLGELAAALGVQAPAASKVVDRLAAAGLVERRRDGRAVRLFPMAAAAGA